MLERPSRGRGTTPHVTLGEMSDMWRAIVFSLTVPAAVDLLLRAVMTRH